MPETLVFAVFVDSLCNTLQEDEQDALSQVFMPCASMPTTLVVPPFLLLCTPSFMDEDTVILTVTLMMTARNMIVTSILDWTHAVASVMCSNLVFVMKLMLKPRFRFTGMHGSTPSPHALALL